MNRFVKSKGRKTIVWEGFSVGKEPIVDKDVLVDVFENRWALPGDLVKAGYDIVNTSWVPLYICRDMASTPQALAEWNPLYFGGGHPPKPLSALAKIEPTNRLKGITMCSWENPESSEEGTLLGRPCSEGLCHPCPTRPHRCRTSMER